MKLLKVATLILMASAVSVSSVPSAFAGGGGCAIGGAVGAIAGSFVGGNARKFAQIGGGLVGCGAGYVIQNKSKQKSAESKAKQKAPASRNSGKATSVAKSNTGKAGAVAGAAVVANQAVKPVADPSILTAQEHLVALGYNQVGKPDGFVGKATSAAVVAFQKDKGLPETGALDATMIALIAQAATKDESGSQLALKPVDAGIEKEIGKNSVSEVTETANASVEDTAADEMSHEEYVEAERAAGPIVDEVEPEIAPVQKSVPSSETSVASITTTASNPKDISPAAPTEAKADVSSHVDDSF
ncbi:peptidoglycan-binding domain-containing protein [Ochrobactrum sp. CGA5]|uniref:peptidoglycan-binding domain-containing protein n=1 Tax=Ochrobactrum sp. CGA5 TaxID=2583453 RepID=UPI0015D5B71F|nr:peptidoglycan-binding domain-containing protein [Ochrobactrum sp. CGA5]